MRKFFFIFSYGLVIERLRNLGSTSDAVARRASLRCLMPSWGQAVYPLW